MLLNAALLYASKGWLVFPVRPDKKPYTSNGFYDATRDERQIRAWWEQWPNAAIGVRCGVESGIVVVDIDAGKGGPQSLAALIATHGDLPDTLISNTGGGGQHFFFKSPGERCLNSVSKLGEGIDVRADGGYAIVAPSRHASGNHYSWATSVAPAELPDWLREAILHRTTPGASRMEPGGGNPLVGTDLIAEGGRNAKLTSMAGVLRAQGNGEDSIYTVLCGINAVRCKPPLPDHELRTIARSVCHYEAGPPLVEDWDGVSGNLNIISGGQLFAPKGTAVPDETDLGNARRFAERYSDAARYAADQNRWLLWTGTHWAPDLTSAVDEMAHAVADSIQEEVRTVQRELGELGQQIAAGTQAQAAAMEEGSGIDPYALSAKRERAAALADQIKYLTKHARETKSDRSLTAMVRRAGKLDQLKVSTSELDLDPFLFNVGNGTLDLRTGTLRPHDRIDYISNYVPITYDPAATCPRWLAFLSEIMCGDQAMVEYLQRAVGHSLTGSVSEQVVFLLTGNGKNGKSTFIEVVQALLGGYAGTASPAVLSAGDRHATEIASFQGKRLMYMAEPKVDRIDTDKLKRYASSEKLKARRMREDEWEFIPTHKLWISMNGKPTILETSEGAWRRFRIIEFNYVIPLEKRRRFFKEESLFPELSGILAWAVQGAVAWHKGGLNEPRAVLEATAAYRDEEDIIGSWVKEFLVPASRERVQSSVAFDAYKLWAKRCDFKSVNIKEFKHRLIALGLKAKPFNRGVFWMDRKLINEGQDRAYIVPKEEEAE
jgi:putative DNA primase/helicase